MLRIKRLVVVSGFLWLGLAAQAEEVTTREAAAPSSGTTNGNVSLTTDYISRGISQTNHQPAIQGGLDWTHSQGFYLGAWGSSLHLPESPGTALEVDAGGGYLYRFSPSLSASLGALYCAYFQNNNSNTWDFPVRLNWERWKVGFNYSPNWGGAPASVWYLTAGWSAEVPFGLTLGVVAGYSAMAASLGVDNYADLRVGLSREVFGLVVDVSGYAVDKRQFFGADDSRAVLTVSKVF